MVLHTGERIRGDLAKPFAADMADVTGGHKKGRLKKTSKDETYTKLMDNLRDKFKILAAKIVPKVYEHGFLLK